MTSIKALLFPLAVCVALLVSECVLWNLDEYWSGAPDDVFSPPAIGLRGERQVAPNGCTYLRCAVVAPGSDDDADDD